MLQSLKDLLYTSEVGKHFQKAKINYRKQLMIPQKLRPLLPHLKSNEKKKQLITQLKRKVNSKNPIQKLKGLIAVHFFMRETFHPELKEFVQDFNIASGPHIDCTGRKSEKQIYEYIQTEIIAYYQSYLQRYCLKERTIRFAKAFVPNEQKNNMVEIVNHGFQAINMCHAILKTQQTFSKMGRYYLDHTEIISLFIMYLEDLTVLNAFIKNIARLLVKQPEMNNPQQIRHNFLFLTQSQKTSDRLSEFYFNRYYIPWVESLFQVPKFMTINCQSFDKVRNSAKKVDNKMVRLVKRSSEGSSFRDKSVASEGNMSFDCNSSLDLELMAQTMGASPQLKKRSCSGPLTFGTGSPKKFKLPEIEFLVQDDQQNVVVEEEEAKETSIANNMQESQEVPDQDRPGEYIHPMISRAI